MMTISAAVLAITSGAFTQGSAIPTRHTCDGTDLSPALAWGQPPEATKSLALICDDPDAPAGTWVHWVLFNLPAGTRSLPEAVPSDRELAQGARQGLNDFGKIGYGGPCPPKGPAHRYYFKLYALDATLPLPAGATKSQVEKAMQGHILAQGELMGRYGR
jgi:Raf kinase inhibitor-like YbhB/YbcL family protein